MLFSFPASPAISRQVQRCRYDGNADVEKEEYGEQFEQVFKTIKVFPHNLRHLFARTYYSLEKDLSRLADILGHTSVATTRIYTMESREIHQKQMNRMGLVTT